MQNSVATVAVHPVPRSVHIAHAGILRKTVAVADQKMLVQQIERAGLSTGFLCHRVMA